MEGPTHKGGKLMPEEPPFIPEFSRAEERNKWIVDHAQFFTTIFRRQRRYERQEHFTFEAAITKAKQLVGQAPTGRVLIYAVAGGHDALAATVSAEEVKTHQ
jgi:hypothetical protein